MKYHQQLLQNFQDFNKDTINSFLFHLSTKMYNSGSMIFDYGSESTEIFIILHGKIDVLIPSNTIIEIDDNEDHMLESKVKCLVYCIQNYEIIMWRVMTYEVLYKRHFDIKENTNSFHVQTKSKFENQICSLLKMLPELRAL
jgi:hypothetical protein